MVCLCPYDWNNFIKTVKANSHAVCLLLLCLKIFFYEEFIFTFEKIPFSCFLRLLKSFNLTTLFWRDLFNWEGKNRPAPWEELVPRLSTAQARANTSALVSPGPIGKRYFQVRQVVWEIKIDGRTQNLELPHSNNWINNISIQRKLCKNWGNSKMKIQNNNVNEINDSFTYLFICCCCCCF